MLNLKKADSERTTNENWWSIGFYYQKSAINDRKL